MLSFVARLAQLVLLALPGYNLLIALFGWRHPDPAREGGSAMFRVVVPAHNEEAVLGRLLEDLAAQDYPSDRYRVVVLADRCTDHTADVAAAHGVEVAERNEGPDGKGAALDWFAERHPLEPGEALVVLDADTRVPAHLLTRFAAELEAGHQALQAYLDVGNPDDSWLATASALQYWASARMVQLARTNLGWTSDLGGTGMCLAAEALAASGGFGDSRTEDQESTSRLLLAGIRVRWLHDLRVGDEKPVELAVALRQRARWAGGRRQVARRWAPQLLRAARRQRSPAHADLAIRLVQPGRTFLTLLSALLALAAWATRSRALLPWQLWAASTAVQVLAPLPFLVREQVPTRYLWRYPMLVVFGVMWVPAHVLGRWARSWYHTPHSGPQR